MYLQWQDEALQTRCHEIPLMGLQIGSDPTGGLSLTQIGVSWHHCRIEFRDGHYLVVDVGSTNGTWYNGVLLPPYTPKVIVPSDTLIIGDIHFICRTDATDVGHLEVSGSEQSKVYAQFLPDGHTGSTQILQIGRDPSCDVVLDDPNVSWRHARLTQESNGWLLEDLESTNGTFLNERRIDRALITRADRVRIGQCRLHVQERHVAINDEIGQIRLDARNLTRTVRKGRRALTLLDNVSLTIHTGELVAIVGASGAGKTTLLLALNGYQPATTGQVLLNNINLYEAPDLFRTEIGYVPQADIVHGELTVESALGYAAQLRMPHNIPAAEVKRVIARTLTELELECQRDTLVRTLSGGERKRVNIGVELLTRPGILFLDEPTTGLDAGLERRVTRQLRALVSEGHTIITVTHSVQTLDEYDKVIWMARGGRLAYCGPPRAAPVFFGVADYAAVYDLLNMTGSATISIATRGKSPYLSVNALNREPLILSAASGTALPHFLPFRSRQSSWRQMYALTRRYLEVIASDTRNLAIWIAQVPFIALIVAFLFNADTFTPAQIANAQGNFPIQDAPRLLFLLTLSMTCFGLCNACREIVKEKAIYHREHYVAVQIAPYLGSKMIVLGVVSLLQSLLLLAVVSWKVDFHLEFSRLCLLIFVLSAGSFMSVVTGLWVSARSSSPDQAITLVALILLVQVIFSGLIPLEQMNTLFGVFASLNSMRWTYGGLCGSVNLADRWQEVGLGSQVQNVFHTSPYFAVGALLIMLVGIGTALYFTLIARDRTRD